MKPTPAAASTCLPRALRAGVGREKPGQYTRNGAVEEQLDLREERPFPEPLPDYLIGIDVSWEVDIWHQLRDAQKSAVLRYLASAEGQRFAQTRPGSRDRAQLLRAGGAGPQGSDHPPDDRHPAVGAASGADTERGRRGHGTGGAPLRGGTAEEPQPSCSSCTRTGPRERRTASTFWPGVSRRRWNARSGRTVHRGAWRRSAAAHPRTCWHSARISVVRSCPGGGSSSTSTWRGRASIRR
jgi:hypothetical protein